MINVYAYYNKSDGFSAHRIIKVEPMKGVDAMYFKGERVSCTEEVKEGWYYDENSQKFMTAQEFEINREKYRTSPDPTTLPPIEIKMLAPPLHHGNLLKVMIKIFSGKNPKHEKAITSNLLIHKKLLYTPQKKYRCPSRAQRYTFSKHAQAK